MKYMLSVIFLMVIVIPMLIAWVGGLLIKQQKHNLLENCNG